MRIVIIGGSHAGVTAAIAIKKMRKEIEVELIEKMDNLAFIPSSANLIWKGLFPFNKLNTGETYTEKELRDSGIDVRLNTEVVKLYADEQVVITSLGQDIAYDYLILATGSASFNSIKTQKYFSLPKEITNFLTYKNKEQVANLYLKMTDSREIVIIGAGLIGMELADALSEDKNKSITIIEQNKRPLHRYFDTEIIQALLQHTPANINIFTDQKFYKMNYHEDCVKEVVLENNDTIKLDYVVLALNPTPNSDLVLDSMDLAFDSTIPVDTTLKTSNEHIYAIGDLIKIPLLDQKEPYYMPLIANAKKEAAIAAYNILNKDKIRYPNTRRTIATSLFGYYLGSTGLTETEALYYQYRTKSIVKTYDSLSSFGEFASAELTIKLIYDEFSRKLLGVQLITNNRVILELINQLTILLNFNAKIEDLLTIDSFFAPLLSPTVTIFLDILSDSLM